MKHTSLDLIVKGLLINRGYPIHWYMQFLYLGARAFEELNFDSLQNIKTVKLPVNSYNAVDVPCDFMDWVKVGIANGQLVQNLSPRAGINNLNNFDANGTAINYGTAEVDADYYNNRFFYGYNQFYNQAGEQLRTGFYGLGVGNNPYTFKFLPERGQIQLYEGINATDIILQYSSDGSSIDNATLITPYAKSAIEMYIIWKMKEGSRAYSMGERMEARRQWEHQHTLLRARIWSMGKEEIMNLRAKSRHGAPKG